MPTYYLTNTDSDLTGGADFNWVLSGETFTTAATPVNVSIAAAGNETSYGFTPSGIPSNSDWETGTISVKINVTTQNNKIDAYLSATRVSSGGTELETTSETALQTLSIIQIYTFTIPSMDWSASTESDRLRINYRFVETNGHNTQSVSIGVNTADSEVTTSISHPIPDERPPYRRNRAHIIISN